MSRASRAGSCDQISSVTCGITGCSSASSRSSAASAVAAGLVVLVQPRLDRLRVPVAEVVEREVVERVRRRGEVEPAPGVLDVGSRRHRCGEDPALLEVARARLRRDTPRRSGGSAARRSRACSRACDPPRSSRTRSGRPASTSSSAARSGSRRRRTRRSASSGSIPVPRLFDIRRPSGALIVEWMFTVWNGISPMSSSPAMIIRASQRKMIPRSVELTSFGYQRGARRSSGQPRVANGQSCEENHVSRTSSSWRSSVDPHRAMLPARTPRPSRGHPAVPDGDR